MWNDAMIYEAVGAALTLAGTPLASAQVSKALPEILITLRDHSGAVTSRWLGYLDGRVEPA